MKLKNIDSRPEIIKKVDIPFKKDDQKIWELDLPVEEMEIELLIWHFDYPFWEKEGTNDWNLTPWELIKNPEKEYTHYQKIQSVDLKFPLQVFYHKKRWLLLDGLHRLTKAYLEGRKTVKVRKVPRSAIKIIKTGYWGKD